MEGILLMENTFFEINLVGTTQENSLETLNDFSTGLLEGATVILQTKDGKTISLNTNEVQAYFEPYEE